MAWITAKVVMIKSWLIAIALFIVGLAAAVFWGKHKQSQKDNAAAAQVVTEQLNKLSTVAKEEQNHVQNLPPSGTDSATQQLRDGWSQND